MTRRTGCEGKQPLTRAEAKHAIPRLRRKWGALVKSYKCRHCGKWHIGNPANHRRRP